MVGHANQPCTGLPVPPENVAPGGGGTPGGSGTGANGSGGIGGYYVAMYAGGVVKNASSIFANGGNAAGTGSNGNGGEVDLFSQSGPTANSATTITVAKGTGGTGGSNGTIYFDFTDVTPPDGTVP